MMSEHGRELPVIQRVAKDSGCAEKDVALFLADFEAMRQSTQPREGDPRAVNADRLNRAERRALNKKKKKKGGKQEISFGRSVRATRTRRVRPSTGSACHSFR